MGHASARAFASTRNSYALRWLLARTPSRPPREYGLRYERERGCAVAGVMQRPFSSGLAAAGGLCALLIGLAVIDDRVRNQMALAFTRRGPTEEIATAGSRLQELAMVVAQALRDQSIEHAPMVIFALAAMVLVLFMTRT
jgi:hypothetical protein